MAAPSDPSYLFEVFYPTNVVDPSIPNPLGSVSLGLSPQEISRSLLGDIAG
jgi:hypothetical protein